MTKKLKFLDHKNLLDEMVDRFNRKNFIEHDPVSIPHRFTKKEDIEISGFLAAIISWGQRPVILKNANRLMLMMDDAPHEFVLNAGLNELNSLRTFVHRTFNGVDCIYLMKVLRQWYREGGLENIFSEALIKSNNNMGVAISSIKQKYFSNEIAGRTAKHFSDPMNNASAKRINMYLRWMVRNDRRAVDFGLWKSISPSLLYCPLDIHSGRTAREFGMLKRKQNDWKAVEELTANLRLLDKNDPVKYDFALFSYGINYDQRLMSNV